MPHECTNCGRTFPDGSKEMLSGCPDCGGNKFQFAPSGRATSGSSGSTARNAADSGAGTAESPDTAADPDTSGTVGRAAETVRGWMSSESDDSSTEPESQPTASNRSGSPTVDDRSTPTAGTRTGSADANRSQQTEVQQTDRSWPDSDGSVDPDERSEPGEFAEWPETARRPEDRSTPPGDASSGIQGDNAGAGSVSPPADSIDDGGSLEDDGTLTDGPTLAESENTAQADARSEVVSTDDLPSDVDRTTAPETGAAGPSGSPDPADGTGEQPPDHGRVVSEPSGAQPSIEELRAELNEQFESIKIVSPGQYELNLMELYNREEYIISLQEDGRYVIDVPDSWRSDDDS
ncbi:OapC/ArvC family zinc-ribbon domain-containing protein [Natronorubrum sp. DTA28]|uniref:Zn-ribbon domain-containing protein n=1 Tax=Natronorubrum sp. DTA28 TaxID=3447019 RepID=UPI003F86E68B